MIVRYSNFDKTVATIAERDSIANKVDGMIVTVMDASADPDVNTGKAVYRWISEDSTWVAIYKGSYESLAFVTEELTITSGAVTASYVPADNIIWDVSIISGDEQMAFPRVEEMIFNGSGGISLGTSEYDGYKLRFTYGYGSITQQLNSALDAKVSLEDFNIDKTQAVVSASEFDLSAASLFTKTISANTTFTVSGTEVAGKVSSFMVEITNGGAYTVTWFSGVKWASGTAPTLTSAGTDVLCFYTYDGGTTWRGLVAAQDIK